MFHVNDLCFVAVVARYVPEAVYSQDNQLLASSISTKQMNRHRSV